MAAPLTSLPVGTVSLANQLFLAPNGKIYVGKNLYYELGDDLEGSSSISVNDGIISVIFGTGVNQVARGNHTHPLADTENNGFISPLEKAKIASIDEQNVLPVQLLTANLTLALTDNRKYFEKSNTTARTITIPQNSSVALPIGFTATFANTGTSANINFTITGLTIRYANRGVASASVLPGFACTIVKIATNTWNIIGGG